MVTWRQWLEEWYWRWIDYHLRERHLSPWARALTRHWQVFTTRMARVMEVAHARVDIYRQEVHRMEETPVAPLPPVTLGRMLMARLDRESAQAIAAAVAEEIRNEVTERCLEEVRAEHAAELQHRLDKLEDDKAKILEDSIDEIDRQVEIQTERVRRELRAEWRDRLQDVREELKAATERATRAEQALLSLLRSLFPEGKNIYAARHMTLKELALQDLNAILTGLGYEIITRHTGSKLAVACRLANGQVARNVFELRKRLPDGVVDEDADTGALALPEGQSPA